MAKPKTKARLPVLTFHHLATDSAVTSFPPRNFAALIDRLYRKGWRTIALPDVADLIEQGPPWPERRFAVTFDDGYASVVREAAPVLHRYDATATVFVTVGSTAEPEPVEGRPLMTWNQLADLAAAGWNIGAHAVHHLDLTTLSPAETETEVRESLDTVGRRMGRPAAGFSYPFGAYNPAVERLVRSHASFAVSDRLGLASVDSNPFAIERVEMFYFRRSPAHALIASPLWPVTIAGLAGARHVRRRMRR